TSANFRQTNSNKTYTLEELDGRLISYGKTISADNPLLPVVYQIKNNADFLPGTFVELYIKTTGTEENITVPNTALVEEMGNYFVYVQLTPEYFEKREVKAGTTDGKRTAILNGIKTGERIVSKGAILVKLAQTTNTLDAHAGHVH
ncbi:MAG: efflux transporter periplasmic adaptor subunit, partial [Bacteroidaceae bacterium]|nr:efflux transporter periplasmic adaptor subunit [Bacteroidaceae bacterium]